MLLFFRSLGIRIDIFENRLVYLQFETPMFSQLFQLDDSKSLHEQ